mmetsp:Transcript_9417/g.15373  ORF Transcript_9417/g.15373 Transcript_9417/m.15373 type:complete len:856 (-) Transcript_9417:1605-4172(-)
MTEERFSSFVDRLCSDGRLQVSDARWIADEIRWTGEWVRVKAEVDDFVPKDDQEDRRQEQDDLDACLMEPIPDRDMMQRLGRQIRNGDALGAWESGLADLNPVDLVHTDLWKDFALGLGQVIAIGNGDEKSISAGSLLSGMFKQSNPQQSAGIYRTVIELASRCSCLELYKRMTCMLEDEKLSQLEGESFDVVVLSTLRLLLSGEGTAHRNSWSAWVPYTQADENNGHWLAFWFNTVRSPQQLCYHILDTGFGLFLVEALMFYQRALVRPQTEWSILISMVSTIAASPYGRSIVLQGDTFAKVNWCFDQGRLHFASHIYQGKREQYETRNVAESNKLYRRVCNDKINTGIRSNVTLDEVVDVIAGALNQGLGSGCLLPTISKNMVALIKQSPRSSATIPRLLQNNALQGKNQSPLLEICKAFLETDICSIPWEQNREVIDFCCEQLIQKTNYKTVALCLDILEHEFTHPPVIDYVLKRVEPIIAGHGAKLLGPLPYLTREGCAYILDSNPRAIVRASLAFEPSSYMNESQSDLPLVAFRQLLCVDNDQRWSLLAENGVIERSLQGLTQLMSEIPLHVIDEPSEWPQSCVVLFSQALSLVCSGVLPEEYWGDWMSLESLSPQAPMVIEILETCAVVCNPSCRLPASIESRFVCRDIEDCDATVDMVNGDICLWGHTSVSAIAEWAGKQPPPAGETEPASLWLKRLVELGITKALAQDIVGKRLAMKLVHSPEEIIKAVDCIIREDSLCTTLRGIFKRARLPVAMVVSPFLYGAGFRNILDREGVVFQLALYAFMEQATPAKFLVSLLLCWQERLVKAVVSGNPIVTVLLELFNHKQTRSIRGDQEKIVSFVHSLKL